MFQPKMVKEEGKDKRSKAADRVEMGLAHNACRSFPYK